MGTTELTPFRRELIEAQGHLFRFVARTSYSLIDRKSRRVHEITCGEKEPKERHKTYNTKIPESRFFLKKDNGMGPGHSRSI